MHDILDNQLITILPRIKCIFGPKIPKIEDLETEIEIINNVIRVTVCKCLVHRSDELPQAP